MKKINRTAFFSILLVLAYLLSACSGAPAGQNANSNDNQQSNNQVREVVFTGTVDSIGPGEWTVSGQTIKIDAAASLTSNIVVGDNVKVEAQVGPDGSVTAVKIEVSGADDSNSNTNSSNVNDNTGNSNDNQADNSNSLNGNENVNDNASVGNDQEVNGVIEAITTDSITINGVTYAIAGFTEIKDLLAVGDQAKVHVIVNADGTFTIREIEKSAGTGLDNGNSNGSDDNSNLNSNTNGDDSGGGNNNDSNGNDDNGSGNGNDDSGGDNGNDSGGGNGNGNG